MKEQFEYATLEWLWDIQSIRINLPDGEEQKISNASYAEVVDALNNMGKNGWASANCVASGNWLFWTLQRVK